MLSLAITTNYFTKIRIHHQNCTEMAFELVTASDSQTVGHNQLVGHVKELEG